MALFNAILGNFRIDGFMILSVFVFFDFFWSCTPKSSDMGRVTGFLGKGELCAGATSLWGLCCIAHRCGQRNSPPCSLHKVLFLSDGMFWRFFTMIFQYHICRSQSVLSCLYSSLSVSVSLCLSLLVCLSLLISIRAPLFMCVYFSMRIICQWRI